MAFRIPAATRALLARRVHVPTAFRAVARAEHQPFGLCGAAALSTQAGGQKAPKNEFLVPFLVLSGLGIGGYMVCVLHYPTRS